MYRNFKISEEEKRQILEQHEKFRYENVGSISEADVASHPLPKTGKQVYNVAFNKGKTTLVRDFKKYPLLTGEQIYDTDVIMVDTGGHVVLHPLVNNLEVVELRKPATYEIKSLSMTQKDTLMTKYSKFAFSGPEEKINKLRASGGVNR